jgi:O-methyltransferase
MDFRYIEFRSESSRWKLRWLTRLSAFTRKYLKIHILPVQDPAAMMTCEQAVNLMHFTYHVIHSGVEGDLVELGSFTGSTAMHIQQVLDFYRSPKKLHLFDRFDETFFEGQQNTLITLKQRFQSYGLSLPIIHKGDFRETLPGQLPEKIALVHIDCGFGAPEEIHRENVLFCLHATYPRMSRGAIGILMDYHDPKRTLRGFDANPGTKAACDEFFKDKPEKVYTLYGGDFSHGFFRKE